jgi:hypothetical protein
MLTIVVVALLPIFCHAENSSQMTCEELKQFYVRYHEIWDEYPNVIWWQNSESYNYVSSHCTHDFFSRLEDEMTNGVGIDLLTCDYGDMMIMSTMEIKPGDNCYIMTFKADGNWDSKGKYIKDVILHIYTENGLICNIIESKQ